MGIHPADSGDLDPNRGLRKPRLIIKEMVMRNFKSYAGEQRVGPFHKGEVEQISLMKPKAQGPHDEGFLEYLEDIIGTNQYVE